MTSAAARLAVVTALAASAAGCGLGAGASSSGTATLTVTRDYGSKTLVSAHQEDPPSSETVIRFLDGEAEISTRYGGGFVQSINGLAGTGASDWFFYVNGRESPIGSADVHVNGGDRIWWDYRNWSAAMSVPAVVGSWPEPFLSGEEGRQIPLAITCGGTERACDEVRTRLGEEDVKRVSSAGLGAGVGQKLLRIVVGPWKAIKDDPAASLLAKGPAASGVYARPTGAGIELLDEAGKVSRTLTGGGLIAATRFQDQQPTWIITGSDDTGVEAAAASLREDVLENRFAVAIDQGRGVPLPIRPVP
jgi:hypothetical protein